MIDTERLVLRPWRQEDASAHRAMCNDSRVAAALGDVPSMADSRDVVTRQNALMSEHGHCFWVMEHRKDGSFAGWCGLKPGTAPIDGETEIGWSTRPDLWRQGLALEGATAVLDWAWRTTDLTWIVAIAAAVNVPSQRLMIRLGMQRDVEGDFEDLERPLGDSLRRHVLYRIARPTA